MKTTFLTLLGLAISAILYISISVQIKRRTKTLGDHIPLTDDDSDTANVENSNEFSAATVATTISLATVILAYAELASWAGTWLLWTVFTTAIGIFAVRLAAPTIWKRLQSSGSYRPTLHGFLGASYSSVLLIRIAALCTSLGFIGALAVELTVGSRFLASLAPNVPLPLGIVLISSVGVIYTALGGFRAVIITDRIQMLAIWGTIVALVLLIAQSISNIGGFSQSLGRMSPAMYDFSIRQGLIPFLVGISIINIPTYLADMSIWQRIAASKSKETVTTGLSKSVLSASVSWTLLAVIACLLTVVIIPKDGENPLLTYLLQVGNSNGNITAILFLVAIVGLFAASLSTASTQLIAAGHAIHIDLLRHKSDRTQLSTSITELKVARLILIITSVISVAVVEGLQSMGFNIADLVFAVFGAQLGMVPAVLLALFAPKQILKSLGSWVAAAVALGFVSGWGAAIYGKAVGEGNLVFLAPAISLFVSATISAIGYLYQKFTMGRL